MRVTPITPVYQTKNTPHRKRALMAVNHNEHTVIDSVTGERHILPANQAWELYERLNDV